MTIDEARDCVGLKVVYRAPHVRPDEPGEEGAVTSVNGSYVFVRFGTHAGSSATPPEALERVSRSERRVTS